MKTLFILPLILMALFVGACSEAPMEPEVPKISEMRFQFGISNAEDYAPFAATTIVMVTGGSGEFVYELFQDGTLIGNDPIQLLRFDSAQSYQLKLKVSDLESGETLEKSITVTGLEVPLGMPLTTSVYTGDFFGEVPFSPAVIGIAHGGVKPYIYELLLDNVVIYEDDHGPMHITEAGEHEIRFRVTDAENNVAESALIVTGFDPDPSIMHVNLIALPQTVELGKKTGLVTVLHGGQAPFEFRIKVDGQVVATQPTYMYEMNTLGELIVMVEVTDATGAFESIGLSIFGVEPEIYEPPTTVRIVAPNEAQQRQDIPFQALVFGEYDLVKWYVVGYPTMIGMSDNITHNFQRLGFHDIEARVYYQGNFIVADTARVTITPADENPPLTLEVFGTPQGQTEPVDATLEAHPSGGDGNYSYAWYWPTAATLFSTERFPVREDLMAGEHTFICVVADGVGATARDSLIMDVAEEVDPSTVTWLVEPNLQVGPNGNFATTTATVEVAGDYNAFVQVEWDAVHAGTQDELLLVLVKNVNGVEHQHVWHLIKPASYGHVTVIYEVGNLNFEQGEVTLNMHWLDDNKSSEKCDGWDKWQLIAGNATIPVNKSGDAMVIRLDDPDRDQYIKRQ